MEIVALDELRVYPVYVRGGTEHKQSCVTSAPHYVLSASCA